MTTLIDTPRAVIPLPVKNLVPGLQVAGEDLAPVSDPVTVTAVDRDGDRLLLSFDHHTRAPFGPDAVLSLVCAPTDHPAWCQDPAACEAQRDSDGSVYHGSAYAGVTVTHAETGREDMLLVSLSRIDDPDGEQGATTLHILPMNTSGDIDMPPAVARDLAVLLLAAADQAEPECDIDAQDVHVGDEILTPDGWQTVTCVLADGYRREVGIYTVRDEDPVDRFDLAAKVRVRRAVTA